MTLFQLIIVQVITFVLVVVALRKLFYTQASSELKRLQLLADESNKKVNTLRKKIEEAETEYQRKITQANEDARRIRDDSKKESDDLKGKTLEEARQETEKMIRFAQSKKDGLEKEMKNEIMGKSIDLSKGIIKQVLSAESLELIHEAMVAEMSHQINNVDLSSLDKKDIKEVEIITIFPLKKESRDILKTELCNKLNAEINLRERIDDSVVAGIIIRLGNLILDGSLANKLAAATEELQKRQA